MVAVRRVAELAVGTALAREITGLLRECFPGYPDREYYKLPPQYRFLADDGRLAGQLGFGLRVIRVGTEVLRVLAVEDVCVRRDARSRGVASRLLTEVTALARDARVDFLVLFADDERLYSRHGWVGVDNPVTWLKIHEHRTLGVAEPVPVAAMMVRPAQDATWPTGEVDLLGHVC